VVGEGDAEAVVCSGIAGLHKALEEVAALERKGCVLGWAQRQPRPQHGQAAELGKCTARRGDLEELTSVEMDEDGLEEVGAEVGQAEAALGAPNGGHATTRTSLHKISDTIPELASGGRS
jgi:hypothetical protein